MTRLDWLIIGGGVHGVHLAVRLLGETGVDASRLAILDPAERLLDRWRTFTAATGMTHLRSAGVHHLDIEPGSLKRMAGSRRLRPIGLLRGRYDRPALDLFNAHCDRVIERFGLASRHLRGLAERLQPKRGHVHVTLRDGRQIEAKRVVLAIGAGCQPEWPAWAPRDSHRIQHIFSGNEDGSTTRLGSVARLIVVGGGISAAQVALRHVDAGRSVTLVSRHRFRVHHFDSDPGWLGPKLMPTFRRHKNPDRRREILQDQRHRGSVTPEVHQSLRAAMGSGRLGVHQDVSGLQVDGEELRLELASGEVIEGSRLLLATGFAGRRPGGEMLDRLVEEYDLPCASCGYPVVDKLLRWHDRIHVSGPLAELELGPVARNIAGARRAGDRLVQVSTKLRAAA